MLHNSTHDTTAISANLVIGVHPVLNAASRIRFQALSASPVTEKGCLAGVSSNCFDIAKGKLGVGEGVGKANRSNDGSSYSCPTGQSEERRYGSIPMV